MGKLVISDPIVVAETDGGRRQIVAQKKDIKAGEFNGQAQVRAFSVEGKGVADYGRVQSLQSLLKFTTVGWDMLDQEQALARAGK